MDGTPATPEATEEMMQRIAFIRITHYGGFYDFTADLAHGRRTSLFEALELKDR